MSDEQVAYFPMHESGRAGIAFEHWKDERSVQMHQHHFYEMFLIEKGSSHHYYQGTETLLIPGDVLIVSPNRPHALSMKGEVAIFNIQFLPEVLTPPVFEEMTKGDFLMAGHSRTQPERMQVWQEVAVNKADYYKYGELQQEGYEFNKNRQGVIHLIPQELTFVRQICERAILLTGELSDTETLLKARYTELMLLTVKQAFDRSRRQYGTSSRENQRAVSEILLYIESHIAEKLDFDELALQYGYSSNYFRKIFRSVTGFSPVQYVNRLRVTIACSLMQEKHLSADEAAYEVGVYDMNYFIRMFKKVMGVTPAKMTR